MPIYGAARKRSPRSCRERSDDRGDSGRWAVVFESRDRLANGTRRRNEWGGSAAAAAAAAECVCVRTRARARDVTRVARRALCCPLRRGARVCCTWCSVELRVAVRGAPSPRIHGIAESVLGRPVARDVVSLRALRCVTARAAAPFAISLSLSRYDRNAGVRVADEAVSQAGPVVRSACDVLVNIEGKERENGGKNAYHGAAEDRQAVPQERQPRCSPELQESIGTSKYHSYYTSISTVLSIFLVILRFNKIYRATYM